MAADRAILRRVPALRVHLGVCVVAAVATAVAVLVQAQVLATGLSDIFEGDAGAVRPLVVSLAVVGAVRGVARWATDRSSTAAVGATRKQVANDIVRQLDALDDTSRDVTRPAAISALATTGVDALEPWIRSYLPALCLAAIVPLAAGVRILFADVLSAVILLLAIPLIPVFMVLIGKLTDERSQRQWATLQRLGNHFHDVLVGLETLRLFGRADAQIERVREVTDDYRRAVLRTLRVAFLSALVLELLATLSVALVAVTAGVRLADEQMTLSVALLVLLLAPECSLPIRRVGAAFHAGVAGSDAVAELEAFDQLSVTPDGSGEASPGALTVAGLIVDDAERGRRAGPIDLVVEPGEVVALRGPTGSGKSTVLAAVAGEIPITAGTITLGGTQTVDLSRTARRSTMVTIPQHPAPLGTSVSDSIVLGTPTASDVQCMDVLARVGLGDVATRHPGELSGGELQRVAVARALLAVEVRGVALLLADEPTAHLDAASASLVIRGLRDAATAGVAVLVVSHDAAVLDQADRVVDLHHQPNSDPTPSPVSPGSLAGPALQPATARPAQRLLPEPIPGDERPSLTHTTASGSIDDVRWFMRLAPASRSRLTGARALGFAAEACTVGLAATAAWLILRAAEHPSFADLAVVAVAVRAFGLGKGVLRYAERLASHDATLRQLGEIRAAVVARLGRLVPAGLPRTGRGEMLAAVVDDVDRLGDLELRILGPAISAGSVAIGAVIGVAVVAGPPAWILLFGVVVAAVLLPLWVARRGRQTATPLAASKAVVATELLDLAERSGEVAALSATNAWAQRIDGANTRVAALERVRGNTSASASGVAAALGPWVAAATAWNIGGASSSVSGPAIGVAVLLPLAVIELLVPAIAGAELLSTVGASAARLRALVSRPDPTPDPTHPLPPGRTADLALRHVTLGWPDEPPALSDLDLELDEGARLTVRGPSGSGKSTLAAGLVGFLTPASGTYDLGGVRSDDLGGTQIRKIVTWCPQEPWLADTTIRENLRIASPDADDPTLWHALETLRLADWVHTLPEGLDTSLGRGGSTASGGQRHRLALARVVLSEHRVVVLDEPGAHLDADTAEAVLGDLLEELDGRTVILISHQNDGVASLSREIVLPA